MTLNELYRKTLEKLQVVAAGEPADPDDTQLIASKYTRVYNQLAGLNLVSWTDTGDVPDEAGEQLVMMLAYAAAREFGANGDPSEGAIGLPTPSLAERQLRHQLAGPYVSYPAASEYF